MDTEKSKTHPSKLTVEVSTRELGGADLICECGEKVQFVMHWDFLEGSCKCGNRFTIKVSGNISNCCCGSENSCLFQPEGKHGLPNSVKHILKNHTLSDREKTLLEDAVIYLRGADLDVSNGWKEDDYDVLEELEKKLKQEETSIILMKKGFE